MTQWWTDEAVAPGAGAVGVLHESGDEVRPEEVLTVDAPPSAEPGRRRGRSGWVMAVGLALILAYVAIVTTQQIVTFRFRSVVHDGTRQRFAHIGDENVVLWLTVSLVAGAVAAAGTLLSLRHRAFGFVVPIAGLLSIAGVTGAVAGPNDWIGETEADSITNLMWFAAGALGIGVTLLLGALVVRHRRSWIGAFAGLVLPVALAGTGVGVVAAHTDAKVDARREAMESSEFFTCEDAGEFARVGSLPGRVVIVGTTAINDDVRTQSSAAGSVSRFSRDRLEATAAVWSLVLERGVTIEGEPVRAVLAGSKCPQPNSIMEEVFDIPDSFVASAVPALVDEAFSSHVFGDTIMVFENGRMIAQGRLPSLTIGSSPESANAFFNVYDSILLQAGYRS